MTGKAVLVRKTYPGTDKQGLRVVTGFADEIEADVFAKSVAKKANVLLDRGDSGDPVLADVIDLKDELEAREFKQADFDKGVRHRRDEIAEREEAARLEGERRKAEREAKEREEKIRQRALELAQEERDAALARLRAKAASAIDQEKS